MAATGAVPECLGAFFSRGEGLAFQAKLEHLLRENFTNVDDQVFELSQRGTPLGTFGSPDAVRKVFGDALDERANFFYLGTPFFVACHPSLLLEVVAKVKTNLPRESTKFLSYLANHVLHPRHRDEPTGP